MFLRNPKNHLNGTQSGSLTEGPSTETGFRRKGEGTLRKMEQTWQHEPSRQAEPRREREEEEKKRGRKMKLRSEASLLPCPQETRPEPG